MKGEREGERERLRRSNEGRNAKRRVNTAILCERGGRERRLEFEQDFAPRRRMRRREFTGVINIYE